MHEEIVISGFGGQGVLFASQLLAYAALDEGRHVTWIPSYGPEMRGGTAHCTIVISDEEIGSPLTRHPTVAVALNAPSMERYAELVKAGGVLLLDATLVSQRSGRDDVREIAIPAKEVAEELGMAQIANVVVLGALAEATGVVHVETLAAALAQHLGERHRDTLHRNIEALRRGSAFVREGADVSMAI